MSTTHTHRAPSRPWPTEQLETHDDRSKCEHAAFVLQSRDHLWWYANSMNYTLPQTRTHFTKILSGLDPSLPPPKYTSVRPGAGILPPSQRSTQPAEPQRPKRRERERTSLGTAGTGDGDESGVRKGEESGKVKGKGKGKERERRSDGAGGTRRVSGVGEGGTSVRRVSGRVWDVDGDVEMTMTTPGRASPRARVEGQGQMRGSVLGTASAAGRRSGGAGVEPEPELEPEIEDEVEVEADGGVRIE